MMTPRRNKLFAACVAVALILACVPAGVTPVPPLDPNAVQLYLQQTAAVAATQTRHAAPTFTLTPTFTSTPRNTFTPLASFTPFQTFVFPTPSPAQKIQYFRVKHDSQLAIYDFKSRTAGPTWTLNPQTPETVPLSAAAKEGTGTHRTIVDGAWERYIDALNDFNERKIRYLKAPATALFNGSGFPNLESLTMGGNIITLDAIEGTWGRVRTMSYGSPPSAETDNYTTRPDLVHKFVVVVWSRKTKSTYWVNPPPGDIYWPFVSGHKLWIQMDRLEPFPILPMLVTASQPQDIRKEPKVDSDLTGYSLSEGESVTIVQYYPSGSDVWARLQTGRWIALFRYEKGKPTYFTSWSMATLPPPP